MGKARETLLTIRRPGASKRSSHWEGVPFMRKEVKLGMTLGGGAVALLVGYLLVAPPSNKKGTQLVGSGGGGSIIDNSQPGDLSAGSGGEDRGSAAKPDTGQGAPANNGAAGGN